MKPAQLSPREFRQERRERRMRRTADLQSEVRRWAAQRGFALRVLNEGHHWLFERPGLTAEWWPSSAKLVLDRDYGHSHHAPHWPEVAAVLERVVPIPHE